jgi:hypothetical protein
MNQSKVVAATKLPGISDLPLHAKFHFAKALLAEQEGEYLLAELELNRAVAEEAKAASSAPVGNN